MYNMRQLTFRYKMSVLFDAVMAFVRAATWRSVSGERSKKKKGGREADGEWEV